MDLSQISTEDLQALKVGDMSKVSTGTLQLLRGGQAPNQPSTSLVEGAQPPQVNAQLPQPQPVLHEPLEPRVQAVLDQLKAGGKVSLGKAGVQKEIDELPWYKQFVGGLGSAPVAAYQSIKQLLGRDVSPADIEAWRSFVSTGAGAGGNIAGNIAMFFAPGGALERAITGGRALGKTAATLGRTGAAMGVAGAEGGLLTPVVDDESRVGNAAKSSLFAGTLGAAGRAATGLVRPSKEAEQLAEKGIQTTVGQGGEGMLGKTLGYFEDVTGAIPGAEQVVKKGRESAEKAAIDVAARRGSPYGASAEKVGRGKYFEDMDVAFNDAYTTLLSGKNFQLGKTFRKDVRSDIDTVTAGMSAKAKRKLEEDLNNVMPSKQNMGAEDWFQLNTEVRRLRDLAVDKHGKSGGLDDGKIRDAYEALYKRFGGIAERNLPADELARLRNVDDALEHSKILEKAAGYRGQGEGGVSVHDLIKAVESTPKGDKIRNAGRFQDITEPAAKVFGKSLSKDAVERRIGNMVAAAAVGTGSTLAGLPALLPAVMASGMLTSQPSVAKLVMGQTGLQRRMAEFLRGRIGTITATLDDKRNEREE